MTALSFVWVHPYSKNSRCDSIELKSFTSCTLPILCFYII